MRILRIIYELIKILIFHGNVKVRIWNEYKYDYEDITTVRYINYHGTFCELDDNDE